SPVARAHQIDQGALVEVSRGHRREDDHAPAPPPPAAERSGPLGRPPSYARGVALTTEPLVPVPAAPEGHRYQHLTVERIAGGCRPPPAGAAPAVALDDAVIAEIRRALLDHHVVFFREQRLTAERQVTFSRRFGPFSPVPFIEPIAEHPEVI